MLNSTQRVKILAFELNASQRNVDALNERYGDNINVFFRYLDPSSVEGGYTAPEELERTQSKDAFHPSKVGVSIVEGYQKSAGKDAKSVFLEVVIVKMSHHVPADSATLASLGSTIPGVIKKHTLYGIRGDDPFTEEQVRDNPYIQQIKKGMDIESARGQVSGANFSFGHTSSINTHKSTSGVFSRVKSQGSFPLDHVETLFKNNKGAWGNTLVAVAKQNYKVYDGQLSKDSPAAYENKASTASRLEEGSNVFVVDNEPVAAKDVARLGHNTFDYFKNKAFKGNSYTAPYYLSSVLVTHVKQSQDTNPYLTDSRYMMILQKSLLETAVNSNKEGVTNIHKVISKFKHTYKANKVIATLEKAIDLKDEVNPRLQEVKDFFKNLNVPVEDANIDISNI